MYQLWLLMPGSAAAPHGFGGVLTVALQRHNLLQQQQTVVHLLGATDAAEGLVDWVQQAAPEACDGTTLVLVGPQLTVRGLDGDDENAAERGGGCALRRVRGLYSDAVLRAGLKSMPRLWRPDLVVLFNADLYACPWRRTLLHLLMPKTVTAKDVGGSPPPVVLTTEFQGEAEAVARLVFETTVADLLSSLPDCDALVRELYPTTALVLPALNVSMIGGSAPVSYWASEPVPGEAGDQANGNWQWMSFGAGSRSRENAKTQTDL